MSKVGTVEERGIGDYNSLEKQKSTYDLEHELALKEPSEHNHGRDAQAYLLCMYNHVPSRVWHSSCVFSYVLLIIPLLRYNGHEIDPNLLRIY